MLTGVLSILVYLYRAETANYFLTKINTLKYFNFMNAKIPMLLAPNYRSKLLLEKNVPTDIERSF